MQTFTFITDCDGASGKVASQGSRTVVRAHVMRKYQSTKNSIGGQGSTTVASRRQGGERGNTVDAVDEQTAVEDHETSSRQLVRRPRSSQSLTISVTHGASPVSTSISPNCHLNRMTDAFAYAGASIDARSCGLIHHYSLECQSNSTIPYQ